MILVSNGGTEQGEDAIAQGLRHIALIAMDSVHHELEGGVNDGAGLLGIQVTGEGGKPSQVCKEGGDGLALALCRTARFHRRLLGEDALRQMRGRVADWGSGVRCEGLVTWNLKPGTWNGRSA